MEVGWRAEEGGSSKAGSEVTDVCLSVRGVDQVSHDGTGGKRL